MNDQYITFLDFCAACGIKYGAMTHRVETWSNHPKPFKLFEKGAPKSAIFNRQEAMEWLAKYNAVQEQLKALTTG